MANLSDQFPSQNDPVLGQNGSPLGYLQLGLQALAPDNVQPFYQDQVVPAVDRGLGLARQGVDAVGQGIEAITPSQDTLSRIFMALEAGGAHQQGRAPMFIQQQQAQQEYALKRQQLSDQLKQQQMQKQQKDEDQVLSLWRDPNAPMTIKKKVSMELARNGSAMAGNLARLADEELVAELDTLEPYLPKGKVSELAELLRQPNADLAPVEHWANYARERKKATQETQFKSERFSDLLQRHQESPFSQYSPEFDELKTMVAERKKRDEEAQKLAIDIAHLQEKNPLEIQRTKQEIARGNAPIVSPGYITPGGETAHNILDPATGQQREVSGIPIGRTQTQDLDPKLTPDQAARISGINQSLNNISDLRDALIPDGKTVDRRLLFTSMFGGLPFTKGRDVERFIEDAIEVKLRLQTGAAANKEEVKKEAAKFKPAQGDSDGTIIGKFDKLEAYMHDTLNLFDPSGVVRARLGPTGSHTGAPPIPFEQAFEDLSRKRPNWSKQDIFRELQRRGVRP